MIYEANGSSSACRLCRVSQIETSTPPTSDGRTIVHERVAVKQHRDRPADLAFHAGGRGAAGASANAITGNVTVTEVRASTPEAMLIWP